MLWACLSPCGTDGSQAQEHLHRLLLVVALRDCRSVTQMLGAEQVQANLAM